MKIDVETLLNKSSYDINDLVDIMKILRSESGCPWDREQTHSSIRKNLIEETYEVVEAIDTENVELLKEELGDLLLQVVFHSQIESEKNTFDFNNVANDICRKLILRHPHIFSDVDAKTSSAVLENWDKIKKQEKNQRTNADVLNSVSKSLPTLMRAQKLSQKAAKCGFDWDNIYQVIDKLHEEIDEFKQAVINNDNDNIKEELGDMLFACCNIARFAKVDSDEALHFSSEKFLKRFSDMENLAFKNGQAIESLSAEQLNQLWEMSKKL